MKKGLFMLIVLATLYANAQQQCQLGISEQFLDINNVKAKLYNGGDMFWNRIDTVKANYEAPKNSGKHLFSVTMLWFGGLDSLDKLMVTAGKSPEREECYFPGPVYDIDSLTTTNAICNEWDRHFKVNGIVVDKFKSEFMLGNINSINNIEDEILFWPGQSNPYLSLPGNDISFAPYVDVNNDNVYNPLYGDYPLISGHQSIWWLMNDVGGDKHFYGNETSQEKIGLEIAVEAFALKTTDAINDATFQRYKITNKGKKEIFNSYVGFWSDVDLGYFYDDYLGCDVKRGMGYAYNGDDYDNDTGIDTLYTSQNLYSNMTEIHPPCPPSVDYIGDTMHEFFNTENYGYGNQIPAVGIDFVKGVKADENDGVDNDMDGTIDEPEEEIKMSNFMTHYSCWSDRYGLPQSAEDYYNYLRTIYRDSSLITNDGKRGLDSLFPATRYMYPGSSDSVGFGIGGTVNNPVFDSTYNQWTEETAGNNKGERALVMSMGPFTFKPGETKEFVVAFPFAQSSNGRLDALKKLKEADDLIQQACDNGFANYPLSVAKRVQKNNIAEVYPTSTSGKLFVKVNNDGGYTFNLINGLGQVVLTKPFNTNQTIDISSLESGMYIYQVTNGESFQSGKIIKK